jgi:hypothetical protein
MDICQDRLGTNIHGNVQNSGCFVFVSQGILGARADLNNVTSGDHPLNHPKGKTPPWLITEFGSSCNQVSE